LNGLVDAHGRAHLRDKKLNRQKQSISSFVAGYKSAVMNKIDDLIDEFKLKIPKFNKNNPLWQRNFHDHIIRNEISYLKISKYILENPIRYKDENLVSFPPLL
jgi:REP element-mobilizing transposase RayT